jgi:catechol 2,3-dioxygenase-like lactoylglutathione lyase family enzyme
MVNKSFRHPNVSRETQPRFPNKNGLAHFYLETEGCRPMAKPEAQHLGLTHLSFSVGSKEEVDRLTQKMSEDGIQIVGQPRTTGDGYYESVVLDPEGNRVEVTV